MVSKNQSYARLDTAEKRQILLTQLCEEGGARLLILYGHEASLPVLLKWIQPEHALIFDMSLQPGLVEPLLSGNCVVRLLGRVAGTLMRTADLQNWRREVHDGRAYLVCDWPDWVEVFQRRMAFRAELSKHMHVPVTVQLNEHEPLLQGRLLNLSTGGCSLELSSNAAGLIAPEQLLERVTIHFPNGQTYVIAAKVLRRELDEPWKVLRLGCEYPKLSAADERQLWYYVCEIERERVRSKPGSPPDLQPSELFQVDREQAAAIKDATYLTPMTRRLSRVTQYLNGQLLALQQGEQVDSKQLSRHSELLIALLEEDREAVLFALPCLWQESALVQHSVAVAARLADMAMARGLAPELVKAITACALVHDLGKALLPPELLNGRAFDYAQRQAMIEHVALLKERLGNCKWLPHVLIQSVIMAINERLDGSGYPAGLDANNLGELSRMAAIVDVVDAMSRARGDRPEYSISRVYRHLLRQQQQLDKHWVQHSARHFGLIPSGSAVRFSNGAIGRVKRLDEQGKITQVRLCSHVSLRDATLGESIEGDALEQLGTPVGVFGGRE
mgnify:CR=1 FL=1